MGRNSLIMVVFFLGVAALFSSLMVDLHFFSETTTNIITMVGMMFIIGTAAITLFD